MFPKKKTVLRNIHSLLALIGLIGATLILSLIHPNSVCAAEKVDIKCFSNCLQADPILWCFGVCGGAGAGDNAIIGGKDSGGSWFQCENGTQVQTKDGDLASEACQNLGSEAAAYCEKNYLGQCGNWIPMDECGDYREYCGRADEKVTRCDLVIVTSLATNTVAMKAKTVGECASQIQVLWKNICEKAAPNIESCVKSLQGVNSGLDQETWTKKH